MRVANVSGRLALVVHGGFIDVESTSGGRFSSDPQAIYDRWDEFTRWADGAGAAAPSALNHDELGSPAPRPRQVFAVGLNFREHADESGHRVPTEHPPVFTKFPSCITGPRGEIRVPAGGCTDWEVELVVVIGRPTFRVAQAEAWSYVAGLAVGQDISERNLQMASTPPQFSLGKSYPGFGPIGPWLVTLDEFADPDDLELGCSINGELMQKARTSDLIFPVPALIATLSTVTPLLPGDVIFTGTPPGVGMARAPQRWLTAGDELVSYVESIGDMRHRIIA
jgi:2-keto-4-pentenoate hydratase/2-oxohepta-3-ene-1,7-dioic acid hydratase in catechol pathway